MCDDVVPREDFLALAVEVAQAYWPDAHGDAEAFSVHLPDQGEWCLDRVFADAARAPRDQIRDALQAMVEALAEGPEVPDSREGILGALVPRFDSAATLLRLALAQGWDPADGTAPPHVELDGYLGVGLALRVGHVLAFNVHERLMRLGISVDEAFEHAFANHPQLRLVDEDLRQGAAAFPVDEDGRVREWELDRGNQGTLWLVLADHLSDERVALFATQSDVLDATLDAQSLALLLDRAEALLDHPRAIAPVLYRRTTQPGVDGEPMGLLEPWFPEERPEWPRIQTLLRGFHRRQWEGGLHEDLDRRELARHRPDRPMRLVGGMHVLDLPSEPCGAATVTTWTAVGGVLPTNTSHVAVVPEEEPDRAYLLDREIIDPLWDHLAPPLPGTFDLFRELPHGLPLSARPLLRKAVQVMDLSEP